METTCFVFAYSAYSHLPPGCGASHQGQTHAGHPQHRAGQTPSFQGTGRVADALVFADGLASVLHSSGQVHGRVFHAGLAMEAMGAMVFF